MCERNLKEVKSDTNVEMEDNNKDNSKKNTKKNKEHIMRK